ncbi:MAG: hypothetical protein ACK5T0_06135 [Vampirovibrionales bacterium]
MDLAIIPDNKKGKNVDEYRPSFRRRSPYPPTTQVKASNFQRNGSVQASLEEQFIKAGQDVYYFNRQISFLKKYNPNSVYIFKNLNPQLIEAKKQFDALLKQLVEGGTQLSETALEIKNIVNSLTFYKSIGTNTTIPPVMKDRFN